MAICFTLYLILYGSNMFSFMILLHYYMIICIKHVHLCLCILDYISLKCKIKICEFFYFTQFLFWELATKLAASAPIPDFCDQQNIQHAVAGTQLIFFQLEFWFFFLLRKIHVYFSLTSPSTIFIGSKVSLKMEILWRSSG